jgi:hypothetical protein
MSETDSNCFLFAGPTLHGVGLSFQTEGVVVLPPAARGDIPTLVASCAPTTLALADGVVHHRLAVGHAELRGALEAGWEVWGLSSMGAIRAFEMRHTGVRGYGRVYRCFLEHEDFRDDEVALVHESEPPYRAVTEPLVHTRSWIAGLVRNHVLTAAQGLQAVERLASVWYGDRSLQRVREIVVELAPGRAAAINGALADFDRHRIKCLDLSDFLSERPWRGGVTRGGRPSASGRRRGGRSAASRKAGRS